MKDLLDVPRDDQGEQVVAADARWGYNIAQAAALLGVSRVTLWRWIRAGRLPVTRLGHRTARIKRADLDQLLGEMGAAGFRFWVGRGLEGAAETEGCPAPRPAGDASSQSDHFVQFYEADAFLLDAVAAFIGRALRTGDSGIVVATPAHRDALEARLVAAGLDVAAVRARGQYLALDAAETLSKLMVQGMPDPERFAAVLGGIIARAREGGRRAHVFGEMVALLAAEGNHRATVGLEQLWNDLQRTHAFSLLCAYPLECLGGETHAELVGQVCAEHTRVIPAESYAALDSPDDRRRAIAELQQKARWLETEIAQRQQAEEQLRAALESERAARATAEAALRARNEFLTIAAHELKTPLTALSGQAQLALRRLERQGHLEPERVVQTLQTIRGSSQKLSRLVSHLLDVSRLESGKLTLEREPTDLAVLVKQVVAGAQAWSAQHTIAVQAPASLEALVDPLRLEQVLTNLLDNAVKYSPGGGPVEVTLAQRDGATLELQVRDRGLGIPPAERGQIFERFYQAHDHDHRSGLGLGLYITRQIVELHGGEIRAAFPPDGGTCFTVRLPIAGDERAAARVRHGRATPVRVPSETAI